MEEDCRRSGTSTGLSRRCTDLRSCETPEFQRQSRDFAEALRKAGKPVTLIFAEGYNHFEIAETLANPYGYVGRVVLEQLGLEGK